MHAGTVVGVDGSETALDAVRWAAQDAALQQSALKLVCAIPFASAEDEDVNEPFERLFEAVVAERRRWLEQAAAAAADIAPALEITQDLRYGKPAAVLVEESTGARRLVVGTRGLGDFTSIGLALGSTAETVAMMAPAPVVVVPSGTLGGQTTASLPIIVGIDGSRVGEPALAAAYEEAAVRGVPLVAAHVWSDVAVDEWFTLDNDQDWASIEEKERAVLAERMAGWQEEYPEVPVQRVVERDRPVRYFVETGGQAQLIVVGSRGRGGLAGMRMGSTSRAILHAAPCPVLVVRSAAQ